MKLTDGLIYIDEDIALSVSSDLSAASADMYTAKDQLAQAHANLLDAWQGHGAEVRSVPSAWFFRLSTLQ